jgi:hypothetical protein
VRLRRQLAEGQCVRLHQREDRVAEVEEQLSVIDTVCSAIEDAKRRRATLRRSILELAFTGKLVPQDPDDEPASVLLERIRGRARRRGTGPRLSQSFGELSL